MTTQSANQNDSAVRVTYKQQFLFNLDSHFCFQMDMKSVGSFYYDNFVSIPP